MPNGIAGSGVQKGSVRQADPNGIAVIGIAARLPGAGDCDQFWENLKSNTSSIREVPPERWDADLYYSPVSQDRNKSVSKWGGFIDGVDLFDPLFFGISPREARVMDPQQRILLELAWTCIEDAGYAPEALRGSRTGVFIGVMNFDYRERLTEAIGAIAGHMSTGAYTALIPGRISYHFDWHGPSMPIDTACSSSLVALHQAVHALQRGECEQALVGGVSVLCSPTHFVSFSKTGMLSPDGLCRTFDDRANGYVRSEGAGLALLKPLPQAIRDGDRIYGVIRGTAVNHGGNVRTVTYPNPLAQADVIASAHEFAGVPPDSVGYIEAHGTGTPKGDPIEVSGLKTAFARLAERFGCRLEPRSCGLASLKANVGHLEPVAGVAGIIKVLLAMKHRTLPGLAHFQQLNHRIDLSDSPFYIVEQTQDWPVLRDADGNVLPRRAGVSSFGFGGANAHAVIEEFVAPEEAASSVSPATGAATMVVLSAKTDDSLQAAAQRLLEWLRRPDQQSAELADISYTLQVGRTAMEQRLAIAAQSPDELRQKLAVWVAGENDSDGVYRGEAKARDDVLSTLDAGDQARLVADWMDKAEHAKVLQLWVKGLAVDWQSLYGECRPRRIGLPTYAFARERYWVLAAHETAGVASPGGAAAAEPAASVAMPAVSAAEPAAAGGLLYFEERWVEQALSSPAGRRIETVLCFASRPETRHAIARYFGALDQLVRPIFVADAAADLEQRAPEFEPVVCGDPQSFRLAFERVIAKYGKADAVLYLWPLEEKRFVTDCSPIVFLLQAAGASQIANGPILLAAQGDEEESRCHWESWIGFERSAGNALANTPVAAIYQVSDRQPDTADLARWAQILWAELQAMPIQSSLYRGDVRQVCRLQPANWQDTDPGAVMLRQGGTYLITGGLGGLGSLFAEHLLRTCAANIVLVGRAPLNEVKQRKLDALARAGGTALYLQADVGDRTRMAECLTALKERFGGLHGVIHAAGVESWQSLRATRWADFDRVLAPKVAGTLVLDQLLRDESIDFLCYFSSSSAIIGDFGACSYAVGNRFQMAHARLRQDRRAPGRTLAINWPLWKDGGMRVGDEQSTQFYLQATGQRLLEAAEGLAVFKRLWSRPAGQYLVMAGDPVRIRRVLKLQEGDVSTVTLAAPAASSVVSPAAAAWTGPDELPLQQRIEQDLLRLASGQLQVAPDRLVLDRNLSEFGFDSINLAALATALTRHYDVEVLPAVFFSYPTLERLANYFADQHPAAMQSRYASAQQPSIAGGAPTARPDGGAVPAQEAANDAIAVIGMSGRFPGARSIDEMWRIWSEGRSVVTTAPADREGGWATVDYRCGFTPGVSEFDPLFFEISPREADNMDPRQRLLLEEAWRALEDAGYGPAQLAARCVGTFVGVEEGDYQRLTQQAGEGEASITSNHNGILAGRLAYFLNLSGPTLAVNTACSSGLVALHQACQSLRNDECDTAIVAAANLLLTPHGYREMDAAGMLSPEGKCYAFDARANGMVPGEAVVVLVLKRAALARLDNDRIHALIVGSGINSDGRTNGITAPNGVAQAKLIESVYRRHRIDPDQIGCVIAHGTGTKLGDPVEVNALIQAFRAFTQRADYCALTSAKPAFGHTLAASGLLSVVGLIEAMRHETIPASLNWQQPNPFIQWQNSPFVVNSEMRHWPRREAPGRTGAVSAFGMSGSNAHVVLQEYVASGSGQPPAPQMDYLFVLSAKTEKALQLKIADLAATFEGMTNDACRHGSLADLCYTLLERRHHFSHRYAFVASSAEDAVRILRGAGGMVPTSRHQGKVARGFRPQAAQLQYTESVLARCSSAVEHAGRFREELCRLAELYCQGYVVAASRLLRGGKPRLVSLPSYPFSRAHHWVQQVACAAGPQPATAAAPEPIPAVASQPAHETSSPRFAEQPGAETLLLVPVWDTAVPEECGAATAPQGRLLVAGGTPDCIRAALEIDPGARVLQADELKQAEALAGKLVGKDVISHVVWLVPQPQPASSLGDATIADQEQGVLAGFRLIKALLALGYGERPLNFSVITIQAQSIGAGDAINATHAGVHGLIGSLAKERPNWKIRLADLPAHGAVPLLEVLSLPADRRGHAWVYRHGEWYRRQLAPVRANGGYRASYRNQGVYIVIGGAGDIGDAWSEHLIRHHQARIVWVGRRKRDADIDARLARLAGFGPAPLYFSADASSLEALQAVRSAVLAQHGGVHGVVHAAMVFANQDLAGMTEQQFLSALRAKVDVSVRITQVFAQDALDFLLFFSSMISLIKNPRQAHYAAGCTFKDAFAQQLALRGSCPVKVVNWGYWAAQKNTNASEVQLLAELGVGLIDPDEGMRALDVLLGSPLDQLGVMRLAKALEVEGMDSQEIIDLFPAY